MVSKTFLQLTDDLVALAGKVAALEQKVAALETWKQSVIDLAATREARIVDLEGYVQVNRDKIAQLDISDEASGWKAWREQQKEQDQQTVRAEAQ